MSEARIKRCCPIFHLNCTNDYFLGWWKNTISYNLFIRINFYFWLIRKTWVEWILHKIMITYDYIIITMMGYEHNKKINIMWESVCLVSYGTLVMLFFYYKLLLFTTDFKWFLCVDKLLLYVMVGLEAGGKVKGGWWWKQYLWSFTYNLSLMNIQS